jgi:DNA-binding transcriptional MerR regulator
MAEAASSAEVRYKIGDVCRIADVQPYVLRYWESEFAVLAPDRSIPGPRTYSKRELDLIGQIKKLLYDEGYTIAGAKKRLEGDASGAKAPEASTAIAPYEPEKIEKPEKAERGRRVSETVPARPRPSSKAGMPLFPETAPVATQPGPAGAAGADPDKRVTVQTPDFRIARAIAELKEILELLSRE